MKKSLIINALILALFAAALPSCQKEDNLLQGEWVRVKLDNIDSPFTEEWIFNNNDFTIRRVDDETGEILAEDSGRYIVKPTFDRTYLEISGFSSGFFSRVDEEWIVFSLKEGELILGHYVDGGLLYRELIKK